jgi:hypothetical protein
MPSVGRPLPSTDGAPGLWNAATARREDLPSDVCCAILLPSRYCEFRRAHGFFAWSANSAKTVHHGLSSRYVRIMRLGATHNIEYPAFYRGDARSLPPPPPPHPPPLPPPPPTPPTPTASEGFQRPINGVCRDFRPRRDRFWSAAAFNLPAQLCQRPGTCGHWIILRPGTRRMDFSRPIANVFSRAGEWFTLDPRFKCSPHWPGKKRSAPLARTAVDAASRDRLYRARPKPWHALLKSGRNQVASGAVSVGQRDAIYHKRLDGTQPDYPL